MFPELPEAEPVVKKRAAKPQPDAHRTATPTTPDLADPALVDPSLAELPGVSNLRTHLAPHGTVPPEPGTTADLESIARLLEAHSDYRLQRRLQPTLHWLLAGAPAQATDTVTVLVLDTETTGLDAANERIIELAMLRVCVDRATGLPVGPVDVYDELEDPGKPIPKEVVALTGIQDSDVAGKRLDEARIAQMLEGVDLVVAHNAGFDRPFVEARLPQFAHLAWSCSFADIDWKAQGRSSAKLENLAQAMGWFYDAHRAEMDCHALLAVLAAPLPIGTTTGLSKLVQAATLPSFRLQATNAPFDAKDKLKARGYRWSADQRVWHTRLDDEPALQEELTWLKENAYNNRAAVVQVEQHDALTKYSSRPGKTTHRQL